MADDRRSLHLYGFLVSERHFKLLFWLVKILEIVRSQLCLWQWILSFQFHLLRLGVMARLLGRIYVASLNVLMASIRSSNSSLNMLISVNVLGHLGRNVLKLFHFPFRFYK
jgi:hypothetical protein